jgi:hypothetical protein
MMMELTPYLFALTLCLSLGLALTPCLILGLALTPCLTMGLALIPCLVMGLALTPYLMMGLALDPLCRSWFHVCISEKYVYIKSTEGISVARMSAMTLMVS